MQVLAYIQYFFIKKNQEILSLNFLVVILKKARKFKFQMLICGDLR